MTNGVILIHGAWHDHHTWDKVTPLLEAAGVPVSAIDLPGAGPTAARPKCFDTRPIDPAQFTTEPSPNAGVTQTERTDAVIAAVREMNEKTGGKAVVLGHSLGGLTVSDTVEKIADELSAVVYLTAFMLPPGMVAGQMIEHPTMDDDLVVPLLMADPAQVGALRMDAASDDPNYIGGIKACFYADVSDEDFAALRGYLHPDEPAQVAGVPSPVSPEGLGSVPRHYVQCLQDRAITLAGQKEMIRMVDEALGDATIVHSMDTSHSPFLSQPQALADLIVDVARG